MANPLHQHNMHAVRKALLHRSYSSPLDKCSLWLRIDVCVGIIASWSFVVLSMHATNLESCRTTAANLSS
jgi:hypothetical protein